MSLKGTPVEDMAEAYWNAFRDGFIRVGGTQKYPLWSQSHDPIKEETMRCMLHAVQMLRPHMEDCPDLFSWIFPWEPEQRRTGKPKKTEKAFAKKVTK